jgi:hypothetical protein
MKPKQNHLSALQEFINDINNIGYNEVINIVGIDYYLQKEKTQILELLEINRIDEKYILNGFDFKNEK